MHPRLMNRLDEKRSFKVIGYTHRSNTQPRSGLYVCPPNDSQSLEVARDGKCEPEDSEGYDEFDT